MQRVVEIEKVTVKPLNQYNNMLNLSYCFFTADMYQDFNNKKWNIGNNISNTPKELCCQVFAYLLFLIICDIIENNITFELPLLRDRHAYIYVKCFQDEEFEKVFRRGAFEGIDYIKSEFKGYNLFFQWQKGMKIKEKPIYITKNLKDWFYSNINSGKQYY